MPRRCGSTASPPGSTGSSAASATDRARSRAGGAGAAAHGLVAAALPVITVGGTNGKGSCVALADAMLRAGGTASAPSRRRTWSTTPSASASRDMRSRRRSLVAAFERIADALGPDTLTFFEFNTLAALPDLRVGRAGRGRPRGRHGRAARRRQHRRRRRRGRRFARDRPRGMAGSRTSRRSRARRQGSFAPAGRPSCGDDAAARFADRGRARRSVRGSGSAGVTSAKSRDADGTLGPDARNAGRGRTLADLPAPALAGTAQIGNAATAIAALRELRSRLPCHPLTRSCAVSSASRCLVDSRGSPIATCEWVLDVAHNPAAARVLAASLRATGARSDDRGLRHAGRQGRAGGARGAARDASILDRGDDRGCARSRRHRTRPARTRGRHRDASRRCGRRGDDARAQSRARRRPHRRLRLVSHRRSRARRARTRGPRRRHG